MTPEGGDSWVMAEIFLKLKFKYLFSKMSSTLDFSGEITVYHSIQLQIYTKRSIASSKDPGILRGSGSTSQNHIFPGIPCLLVILLWLLWLPLPRLSLRLFLFVLPLHCCRCLGYYFTKWCCFQQGQLYAPCRFKMGD